MWSGCVRSGKKGGNKSVNKINKEEIRAVLEHAGFSTAELPTALAQLVATATTQLEGVMAAREVVHATAMEAPRDASASGSVIAQAVLLDAVLLEH